MSERTLAESTRTARIDVALEQVDLTEWLFTLRDDEYQACSRAHLAAGASRTPDGKRMSINVERPGGTLLVQHYIEDVVERARCRVVSDTDALTPMGPTRYAVIWEIHVTPDGPSGCLFTNYVKVSTNDDFQGLLDAHGVTYEQASAAAQVTVDEHNSEEAPLFAKNIEAKARADVWGSGNR